MPSPAAYKLIDEENEVRDQLLTTVSHLSVLFHDLEATLDDYGPSYDKISCTSTALSNHTPLAIDWIWTGELDEIPESWKAVGITLGSGAHRIRPEEDHIELESLRAAINNHPDSSFSILTDTGLPHGIKIDIDARKIPGDFPRGIATGKIDVQWRVDDSGVYALFPFDGMTDVPISCRWRQIPMSQYWLAAESDSEDWHISDAALEDMLAV